MKKNGGGNSVPMLKGTGIKVNQFIDNGNKTLYSNISLREISSYSPDRNLSALNNYAAIERQNKNNKVILVTEKTRIIKQNQSNSANQNAQVQQQNIGNNKIQLNENSYQQQNTSQQQQRYTQQWNQNNMQNLLHDGQIQLIHNNNDSHPFGNSQPPSIHSADLQQNNNRNFNGINQFKYPNVPLQPNLSNLNNHGQSSQILQNQSAGQGENGAVLNIKTVQDINIYNNSFIVNTNGNAIHQNLQNRQQIQLQLRQIQANRNGPQMNQTQLQHQAQIYQQGRDVDEVQKDPMAKKGLKLRKELSGLSSGLRQSRSASLGRGVGIATVISGGSTASQAGTQPNAGQLPSQNVPDFSETYLYGEPSQFQLQTQMNSSKAYQAQKKQSSGGNIVSQVTSQQNIQSLQLNPNQKRVIGNLAAINGFDKGNGSSKPNQKINVGQQNALGLQTGHYQNSNPKQLKQGIQKFLNSKVSSNTSRLLSRNESRNAVGGAPNAASADTSGSLEREQQPLRHFGNFQQNVSQSNPAGSGKAQNQAPSAGSENLGYQPRVKNLTTQLQLGNPTDGVIGGSLKPNPQHTNTSNYLRLDFNAANGQTNSQLVIAQLQNSQKYTLNKNPHLLEHSSQPKLGQTKNLNAHEVRKQSLQQLKNQQIMSYQNGNLTSNKFRNQNPQINELDKATLPTDQAVNTSVLKAGSHPIGKDLSSFSLNIKQDSKFHQQHNGRTTVLNRGKTNENMSGNQEPKANRSPAVVRQEDVAMKAVKEIEDKFANLAQQIEKLKKHLLEQTVTLMPDADAKKHMSSIEELQLKINAQSNSIRLLLQNHKDAPAAFQGLANVLYKSLQQSRELTLLKSLRFLDLGQGYHSVQELEQICSSQLLEDPRKKENFAASEQLLQMRHKENEGIEGTGMTCDDELLKWIMLTKCVAQRRIGDHDRAIETVTECIKLFTDFKDAYLVRGQYYLLKNLSHKALHDFTKFHEISSQELTDPGRVQKSFYLSLQGVVEASIAKECTGDAYKKMKKYKQAALSYQSACEDLQKLQRMIQGKGNKGQAQQLNLRATQSLQKMMVKQAMCAYYQGEMLGALELFSGVIAYFKQFNGENLKVQQKLVKCNFYSAKAILSLKENDQSGDAKYQQALLFLQQCSNGDLDPEMHELYSGNSHFEIAKIFLRQKDMVNAHDFIQRATENNFNSKRLSLYRDFTEGVMQLMKRKIKKGVQILTDLLEILINGQKEIEKNKSSTAKESGAAKNNPLLKPKDRYKVDESDSALVISDRQNETMPEQQSTIAGGKANQIASGKFNKEMYDYLIFNIYMYRSYGFVAIEKYEHALDDLRKAKKISPNMINKASIYNKWLSRGILKMDTEEYLMASKYFSKASLRFPENKDSFCLNAISIVRSYSYSLSGHYIDDSIKSEKLQQTLHFLTVAIKCCCKDQKQASLYFFRGLLHYQLHNFYEALKDFDVAIEEEEEATGQFHLARGRCYACLGILDEALKDLSIAIELDETLLEAYIFRGKCAYLLGDNNLAFHDFQKLIISDQKNPIVHIYAGNLLMTTGAYTDAIKAFDNADTVQPTALAAFQRIRSYCALSELENAFEQMQLCLHLAPNEKFAQFDYKVLLPLLSCVRSFDFSKGDDGQLDKEGEAQQTQIIKNCVAQIQSTIEIYEKGEHLLLKKGQSPMSIQIIPNINRIRADKRKIQSESLRQSASQGVDKKHPAKREAAKVQAGKDAALPLQDEAYSYYRENIFQLEDMYLYKSIFNTYIGNYEDAIADLNSSWRKHIQQKMTLRKEAARGTADGPSINIDMNFDDEQMYGKYAMSQLISPMSVQSPNSQGTDLSDIGLCSLNVREYNYNMIINLILLKKWDQAIKKINEELTQNPGNGEHAKSVKQLHLLRALIYQELGQTEKYNQDLTVYLKNFQKIQKNNQNAVIIEPFDVKGRLCQQFEPIKMAFSKQKSKNGFSVWMRPSFSMPFIKPPNMIPNINEECVQNEFNLKQIDAPMPEAPWVRQCKNQKFEPFKYLQETQQLANEKEGDLKKPKSSLPDPPNLQQSFLKKYLQQENSLMCDDRVVEDIEDLSDTDKVSLISDIELMCGEGLSDNDRKLDTGNAEEGGLGLKDLSKLNHDISLAKQGKVKVAHNGVKISNQKYRCPRQRSCSSCFRLPICNPECNIGNSDQLYELLLMSQEQRNKVRQNLKLDFYPNQPLTDNIKKITDTAFEDTVSEADFTSSSEEGAEDAADKTRGKSGGNKPARNQSSKCTHSRFSSNVGDLEEGQNYIELQNAQAANAMKNSKSGQRNIGDANIQVARPREGQKQLHNDPRLISDGAKAKEVGTKNFNGQNYRHQDKAFNKHIDSIQMEARIIEFPADEDSLQREEASKLGKVLKVTKNQNLERDSMVVMGSKSMDKLAPKKKAKMFGAANLKKNKLAIAFNNLEVEQQNGSNEEEEEAQ